MNDISHPFRTLTLFCKVVDNFGDIGICWRLARQWSQEYGLAVTLWVDDLISFQRICPEVDTDKNHQQTSGVSIVHWRDQQGQFSPEDISDIVIEFFGVDIPPACIDAMTQRNPQPVWLNLEGLTAEEWVEGCHTLSSPHPNKPITKHFFYPGFTDKTGGLIVERNLIAECRQFQQSASARSQFLQSLGVSQEAMQQRIVSLFCYPHAPLQPLLQAWANAGQALACLIPEGVATDSLRHFLGTEPVTGQSYQRGALHLHVLPFVPQQDYDRLLWSCDINFVRGEDSFVRAQWAGKPMIWHIYPQEQQLHHKKLRAFLDRYTPASPAIRDLMLAWNEVTTPDNWETLWSLFLQDLSQITKNATDWRDKVLENGDMAGNLLKFSATLRK